ncbi:MAG: SUMF1/EgtB/PvdO family nonheme iron enzyme [Treponema sp.]|jgi:formylglycine-generating enzyme required for sulfatase activity|nr:SUMF1/EgtB/PvdO family nonheme iron enzyme [Treponema sp.]
MKKVMFALVIALCGAAAFAQNVLVLAPLQNEGRIEDGQIRSLTRLLENALQRTGKFDIIDRGAAEDILREHGFQLSDLSDSRKTAEVGKVLNANFLVRPSVMPLAGELFLESRIVDVNTSRMLNSAEVRIKADLSDAYEKLGAFAAALTGSVGGGGQTGRQIAGNAPANMVLVEGGTFQMGSANGESNEMPVHSVTVKSFYMGKYEVTQQEWVEIMGSNPSRFKGDTLPVEQVSWLEAVEYCNKRSIKEGLTPAYRGSGNTITCDFNASGYRLPTEAEWEYAAKGGNKDYMIYEYSGGNSPGSVAWYADNSGGQTHPAGTKQPNSLGLYDMSGNVWEWCWDWYGSYSSGSQTDPRGASSGADRVGRGGSWLSGAADVRSAYRSYGPPSYRYHYLGFRLVRPQV